MKRVLVVEDDAPVALALRVRLEHAGYEVEIATNGLAGVNCVWNSHPDVMILDIVMPAGGGFRVAESARSLLATRAIPIIFTTAYKDPSFRKQAEEMGAAGFLEKPYDAGMLLELIERVTAPSCKV